MYPLFIYLHKGKNYLIENQQITLNINTQKLA